MNFLLFHLTKQYAFYLVNVVQWYVLAIQQDNLFLVIYNGPQK